MRVPQYSRQPRGAEGGDDGHRPLRGFLFGEAQTYPALPRGQELAMVRRPRPFVGPALLNSLLELALSLSGVGLAVFMLMHLGLLASVLAGAQYMNDLASFLERYYLLHSVAPLLIILLIVHVLLAARKVPTTFAQQQVLLGQMRRLGHLDTWTWAFQVVSGAALLALAAIHLWVVLTDLPIQALKSGERIYGVYLWFYIPFIILVEGHISIGLYRVAAKWGLLPRRPAHQALTLWSAVALGLGFTILATLYGLGG